MGGEASRARRRRGEAGSTSLEVVLLVPVLMLLALFVLWAGRGGRAALVTDLAAEEAATAAALACEEGKPGCEDLVTDVLRARPGLDFLCIGGPRPAPGNTGILEEQWLGRDDLVPDPASGVTVQNTEVSGVGVLGVSFVCETDGAVAPLRGVFPTVEFRGQASEVAVLQGAPKAGVSDAEVTEGDPADPGDPPKLTFTLTLDAPATADVVLPYTITGGLPADGRATEVDDYTPPPSLTVTILEGATTAAIEVEVVRDDLYEADEILELELGDPPDPALLNLDQARRSATGTILDDDDPPYVYARDAASSVTEGDGEQLTFEVGLVAESGVEVAVAYETADGTAEAGNTCGGSPAPDYVRESSTVTFGPGETGPRDVTVTIGDDLCGEGPETVELRLQASGARFSGNVGRGTPCTAEADAGTDRDDCAVGTILDDEPGLSVGNARACENADPVECGQNPGDPAGTLVFTVTRTGPKTPAVTVHVGTADDNTPGAAGASNTDYTALGACSTASPEVAIGAGAPGTATVEVALSDDMLDEDPETLLLELCEPSDNAWIDTSPGRGTIEDDDDPPTVLASDASAAEAGGVLRFDVALSAGSGRAQGVTVEYCTNDGTAAEPDDYTEVVCSPQRAGEVRFGPGETGPKQAVVTVVDDDLDEEDETVVMRLDATNARFAGLVGPTDPCPAAVLDDPVTNNVDESANHDDDCAVGTIEDDDDPPLLRVDDVTALEGDDLEFTVSLVSAADPSRRVAAARPITVNYAVSHGSTDVFDLGGALSGAVSFAAGDSTQPVRVRTSEDALDEDDETFELELSVPAADPGESPAAAVDASTPGTGTITDDDDPPTARILEDPSNPGFGDSATEGFPLSFTVQLDRASGRDVVVAWRTVQKATASLPYAAATGAGSATDSGADYVNVAGGTETITEGNTQATLTVQSVDDGRAPHDPLDERDELFEVWLDAPSGPDPTYRRHASGYRADGRIVDDDEHELRLLDTCADGSFPDFEVCVDEDGGPAVFTVGLFIAGTNTALEASQAVTAPYTTAERPSEGEEAATAGADFTAAAPNSRLTIPAGSDRATVSVAVSDDDLHEHDETFLLRLGAPDYGSLAADRTAIAVIVDDDDEPELTVSDTAAAEGDSLEFTLRLTPAAGRTVSVGYRTAAEGAATAGTACSGGSPPDFVSLPSSTASFAPGTRTVTVAVETCEDSLDEDDPTDGEGNPDHTDDETFTLRLSSFDGIEAPPAAASPCPAQPPLGAGDDGDDCAVGRIADDDPLPALSLEAPAAAVPESATATFTARLDNPSGRVVRAQVAFGQASDTATGGADCGADPAPDYQTAAGTWIEFDPADADPATETFKVVLCDDSLDEDDETFTVRLDPDSVQNATVGAGLAQAEIADDDDEPTVEVVDDADGIGASADEPADGEDEDLTFTVRLSAASAKVVTVDAETFSGTDNLVAVPDDDVPAGDHADYTAVSRTLTLNPGGPLEQTVAVPVLADDEIEGDERLLLRLSAPADADVDANAQLGDSSAVGVIRAQCLPVTADHPAPAITINGGRVTEGQNLVHQFTLDPETCEVVWIENWLLPGPAGTVSISNDDLSPTRLGLQAHTGTTRGGGYFTGTRDDDIDEPDETYISRIGFQNRAPGAFWHSEPTVEVTATVVDNDTSEVSVAAAEPAAEGDDTGGVLEFPVTLSVANSRDVTVTYRPVALTSAGAAIGGQSCTGGADFIVPAAAASVTIAAGQTSATATVALCGDTVPEEDETLQLRLVSAATVAEPNNPSVSLPLAAGDRAAAGTITDDDDACVDPGDDDDPAPAVTMLDQRASESAETMSFTFGIDRPVCEGASLTVSYRTVDGTAESGSDYRAASTTATLAAGDRSVTLAVGIIDDDLYESDETFTLEARWGSGLPARYSSADPVEATGTIDDDDDIFLQVSDAGPVDEGVDLVFTVRLVDAGGSPAAAVEPVRVQYHTRDLTATGGDASTDPGADYRRVRSVSPGRLDFAAGDTSKTVTVNTFTDSRDEGDEYLQLRLTDPSSNVRLRHRGVATGTIGSGCVDPGDPSQGRPEVTFTPLSLAEDAGLAQFSLLAGCATTAATWRLAFSGVTATVEPLSSDIGRSHTFADETADVAVADRLETFAAGRPATITGRVAVNDDDHDERDETVRVRASWVGDLPTHWSSRHWDFTVTVADDDDPQVVAFNDVTVGEGERSAVVAVDLAAPAIEALEVDYTTAAQPEADHPATAGDDYTHTSGRLTIPAGADSATISVRLVDDDEEEDDETFLVRLSNPSGGLRLGDSAAEVTIVDNERCIDPAADPPPRWQAATGFPADHRYSQYHAGEEGERILFGIELERPLCQAQTFQAGVLVDAGGGRIELQWADGRADDDPVGTASVEDLHSGQGSGYGYYAGPERTVLTFSYNTFEDAEIEETETFEVRAFWCRSTSPVCRRNTPDRMRSDWHNVELQLTGSIIDDDDPEVTVANVAAVEAAEDAGEMVFVMNLDPPPKQVATVRYVTAATPSAGRRAATRGLDYTHTEGRLDIPVGSGRALIRVPLVNDELMEFDETFLLRLQAVSGLRMADPTAQGTILDDDTPLPELDVSDPDGVFEGDSVTFTVTLPEESSRTVTVGYRTEAVTATAGRDYTHTAGTLTLDPGETSATITVATLDDRATESTEQFRLRLADENNARVAATDRVTSVEIYDDENPPRPRLSVAAASADEGDPLEFAVTVQVPSLQPLTLTYSTFDLYTASAGSDYPRVRSGRVTIAARGRSATISVPTYRDADADEGDERMALNVPNPSNATVTPRYPIGTIRDGPPIGAPEISVSDAEGVREGGRLAFEVTLEPAPQSEVTVQYRTVDGTAVAPDDYTAARGTLTFAAGDASETIEVLAIEDGVNEVDETLQVELVRVASGDAAIVDGSGEGTIIGEKATISVHDAEVDEEDDSPRLDGILGGHIEVRLDRALEIDLPFILRFSSDTAIWAYQGSGHNPFPDYFHRCWPSVPAGTTVFRCEIVTNDDARYEGAETAEVVLSLSSTSRCYWPQGVTRSPENRVCAPVPTDHAVIGDGTATLTINEDELPPRVQVSNQAVGEVGTLTLEATLAGAVSERTVALDWATEDGEGRGAATGGTSCTRGTDYVSGSGILTYPPADDANPRGTRSQQILVRICPDSAREGDEVFYVRLSRPSHATLAGDTDNDGEILVRITITDND